MADLRSSARQHRWKAAACGLAILGLASVGAPAGAAKPTLPGAPTITGITAGVRSVKVSFAKPASDGGAKITNYRAKCSSADGGVTNSHEGSKSPIFVAGLTAGKHYSCTVAARNKVGLGPASDPSATVLTLATTPGPPTITSVSAKVRGVKVVFDKPSDNGGAKITNYRVKCTASGGTKGSHEGPKSPITVSGLTAGKTYTCEVAARNRVGLGSFSAPSDPVVPLAH